MIKVVRFKVYFGIPAMRPTSLTFIKNKMQEVSSYTSYNTVGSYRKQLETTVVIEMIVDKHYADSTYKQLTEIASEYCRTYNQDNVLITREKLSAGIVFGKNDNDDDGVDEEGSNDDEIPAGAV